MIYALNLYNIVEGKEDIYKQYSIEAGRLLQRVEASVVIAGNNPIRMVEGDQARDYFLVVQFPDEEAFSLFLSLLEMGNLHYLREETTKDYIWTLYQNWNLEKWVNE